MEQTFGMNIIRSFFATLDRAVYGFVSSLYELITELANATIIGQGAIEDLYTRIYTLLGIFMLFKITFSFINYIINPDSFTDKAKGVQNLVRNIILVLILIIITPYLFYQLNRIQRAILNDEIIPKFIMGISTDETQGRLKNQFQMSDECGSKFATAASDGDFIALSVLKPFYQLETSTSDIPNGYCATGIVKPSTYLKKDIFNKDRLMEDTYLVDYKFFLSTVVGIVVVLIFVSFCFDIAVRSVKMAFLEMIAPVPIMSFIDPASGKNGLLAKYAKQVGATWSSLFIRLIALFFAIHIISIIDFAEITQGTKHGILFPLFIILGALIFAKQIPKLIETLFPLLKLGGLQLNPFKRVANDALGGKQVLGAAAGAAGIGIGAAAFAGNKLWNLKNFNKNRLVKAENELEEARKVEKDRLDRGLDTTLASRRVWDAMERVSQAQARYNRQEAFVGDMRLKIDKAKDKLGLAIDDSTTDSIRKAMHGAGEVAKATTKGVADAINSATAAAKEGYKQGSNVKFHPLDIGTKASKERDYRAEYGLDDRILDRATDFFGVKNESGTTSEVKAAIKEQEEILTRINRNIQMMNRSFSDLTTRMGPSEFARAVKMNADGSYAIKTGYAGPYLNDLKSIISQMNTLESQRLAATKELKKQEKIRDSKPGASAK